MFKTKKSIDSQNNTKLRAVKIKGPKRQNDKIELLPLTVKISSRKNLSLKYNDDIPEVALWRMVLLQALEDSTSGSRKRENLSNKFKAKAWIFFDNQDFQQVCTNANINPIKFRDMVKLRSLKSL